MFDTIDSASFWDRAARKYAASPITDPEGYERTLDRVRHHLGTTDSVFEFGCGTGTTALRLAPYVSRIVASDISSEMITIARSKAEADKCTNATFAVSTPDEAPWPDETFDAALGFNILHLVAKREAALQRVYRILKPGGVFISKTPCLREMSMFLRLAIPAMQLFGRAPFVAFLSAEALEREIEAAGFDIVERARLGSRGKDQLPFLVARKH